MNIHEEKGLRMTVYMQQVPKPHELAQLPGSITV